MASALRRTLSVVQSLLLGLSIQHRRMVPDVAQGPACHSRLASQACH